MPKASLEVGDVEAAPTMNAPRSSRTRDRYRGRRCVKGSVRQPSQLIASCNRPSQLPIRPSYGRACLSKRAESRRPPIGWRPSQGRPAHTGLRVPGDRATRGADRSRPSRPGCPCCWGSFPVGCRRGPLRALPARAPVQRLASLPRSTCFGRWRPRWIRRASQPTDRRASRRRAAVCSSPSLVRRPTVLG
jgi:hypothetical protein